MTFCQGKVQGNRPSKEIELENRIKDWSKNNRFLSKSYRRE